LAKDLNTPENGDVLATKDDFVPQSVLDGECDDDDDDGVHVPAKRDGLSSVHEWAYSTGHFNNDLCAAMWFVYLTWYVNNVVGLTPAISGLVLLSGQITDGITTPTVGYLSDKFNMPGGKRNFWYYFGFSFVNICFLGIFTDPPFFGVPVVTN
jgi:Na+/melibiose symporter-like transporter